MGQIPLFAGLDCPEGIEWYLGRTDIIPRTPVETMDPAERKTSNIADSRHQNANENAIPTQLGRLAHPPQKDISHALCRKRESVVAFVFCLFILVTETRADYRTGSAQTPRE